MQKHIKQCQIIHDKMKSENGFLKTIFFFVASQISLDMPTKS